MADAHTSPDWMGSDRKPSMKAVFGREALPQSVLTILPLLLFFPSGVLYTGVLLFLLSLVLSGGYRDKLARVRAHPLFYPVLSIFFVTVLVAVFQDRSVPRFSSAFAHYQIHVFLLAFLAVGAGAWQRRAITAFVAGAVLAATLFYLRGLGLLPDAELFVNYQAYSGNNSIMIGIMLALAAGILLFDCVEQSSRQGAFVRFALFAYVAFALLLFASTRTGTLIFLMLCVLVLMWHARRAPVQALAVSVLLVSIAAMAWQSSPLLRSRTLETTQAIKSAQGGAGKDVRIDLYQTAADMVVEKPWFGHGIGRWLVLNRERAESDTAKAMATPHNDYLLYAAEIGVIGLAAFLWVWVTQLWLAVRMGGAMGMVLLMITLALLVGGAFNAILRDLVFGMPFMILLSVPLEGLRSRRTEQPAPAASSDALVERTR